MSASAQVAIIEHEVKAILSSLAGWMAPESVSTPAWLAPASSEVRHEPYGVVLVIAPFNYPLQVRQARCCQDMGL